MNDSRKPARSSRHSGGQGKRGPVSGSLTTQIYGGILESLLAAAISEDEWVTKLLRDIRLGSPYMIGPTANPYPIEKTKPSSIQPTTSTNHEKTYE
jgi:hypothetical protein